MTLVRSFNNQTMNVQADAGLTSAIGMQVYKDGQSVYASHLANMETDGYMNSFAAFVTNGYYGTQVRGVEMQHFDAEAKGPLRATQRALDIAAEGNGFFIVDTSGSTDPLVPADHGMKTTGHFQMDRNGFLHDEAGNYLLGARIQPDGTVPQFSLLSHLDRVRIPLTPSIAEATTQVKMLGSLPADKVRPNSVKENAVDVFDSLGVAHQLRFQWQKLDAPLLWRLTVSDCENAAVKKTDATGGSWSTPDGGIIVSFDEVGKYKGWVEPGTGAAHTGGNPAYAAWDDARMTRVGAETMMKNAQLIVDKDASITPAALKTQLDTIATTLYSDPAQAKELAGAQAVNNAIGAGADITAALTAGEAVLTTDQTDEKTKLTALQAMFTPDVPSPDLFIGEWKDHLGNVVGSNPSTIALSLKHIKATGDEFQTQTPKQNGSGSTDFQSITIGPDGFVMLDFVNQPSKKTWLIPLINYPNNNGFNQDSRNVLRPTPECGESYVLAGPTSANLGTLRNKMVVGSNVNPQHTLLKAHQMAEASQSNATLYKMAMELNNFLLQIFAQI